MRVTAHWPLAASTQKRDCITSVHAGSRSHGLHGQTCLQGDGGETALCVCEENWEYVVGGTDDDFPLHHPHQHRGKVQEPGFEYMQTLEFFSSGSDPTAKLPTPLETLPGRREINRTQEKKTGLGWKLQPHTLSPIYN